MSHQTGDNLRDRIAAHRPYGVDCKCGTPINSDEWWADHLIAALGLREETEILPVRSWRPHDPKHRYVTEWTTDD